MEIVQPFQCPLPPGPALDLLQFPQSLGFNLALMTAGVIYGLFLPGSKRIAREVMYYVVGVAVIFGGYLLGYGYAQHWYDALTAWDTLNMSVQGCLTPGALTLLSQERHFALNLWVVGGGIMFIGMEVGAYPGLERIHAAMQTRRRARERLQS